VIYSDSVPTVLCGSGSDFSHRKDPDLNLEVDSYPDLECGNSNMYLLNIFFVSAVIPR
jgi:hypothetical protein